MQNAELAKLKTEIEKKRRNSDYVTLSELLKIPQDAARKRYERNNEEAVLKMKLIVDNRENLIKNHS